MENNMIGTLPAQVSVEDGIVLVDAPGAIIALTPEAAEQTAARLMTAVSTAKQQSGDGTR